MALVAELYFEPRLRFCYEFIPKSSKVVLLDLDLPVRQVGTLSGLHAVLRESMGANACLLAHRTHKPILRLGSGSEPGS